MNTTRISLRQAGVWLALLLLVPVQGTLMPGLWGVQPNLAVLLVYAVAVHRPPLTAGLVGALTGLLLDAASGRVVGVQALSLFLTGYAIGIVREKFFRITLPLHAAGLLLAALLEGSLTGLILASFGFPVWLGPALVQIILPQAVYTAGLGFVLMLGLWRFAKESRLAFGGDF